MKRFFLMVVPLICILGYFGASFAATTAYVTDSFKITLRSGPSTENRILSLLPSGQPLEVVETKDDWTHVRIQGRGDTGSDGWVLSRYLIERLPWKRQAEALRTENATLKERLNQVQKEISNIKQVNAELITQLNETQKSLKDMAGRYNSLKEGASEYLQLKQKYARVMDELEKNQAVIKKLIKENNEYRYSEKKKWFALGAMVLLSGLLIGIIIGRQQRKRRSYLY